MSCCIHSVVLLLFLCLLYLTVSILFVQEFPAPQPVVEDTRSEDQR